MARSEGIYNTLSEQQKKSVFWGGAIDHLPDPMRSTRARIVIPTSIFGLIGVEPSNGDSFANQGGEHEFAIRIQKVPKIPEAKTKDKAVIYGNFPKYFPVGQDGIAGEFTITGPLYEELKGYETLLAWNQTCFNSGYLADTPATAMLDSDSSRVTLEGNNGIYLGLGQQENYGNTYSGLLRNATIRCELFDWMYGNCIMSVCYVNAWPKSVKINEEPEYSEDPKLMTWSATFRYDRPNIYIPKKGYQVIGDKPD
jgi:hypothetical protein